MSKLANHIALFCSHEYLVKYILGNPHISIFSTRNVICSFGGGGGGGGLQLRRFSVNIMEKFDSFFESLNISESSLQSIKTLKTT